MRGGQVVGGGSGVVGSARRCLPTVSGLLEVWVLGMRVTVNADGCPEGLLTAYNRGPVGLLELIKSRLQQRKRGLNRAGAIQKQPLLRKIRSWSRKNRARDCDILDGKCHMIVSLPKLPLPRKPVAVKATVGIAVMNRAFHCEVDLRSSTNEESPLWYYQPGSLMTGKQARET